VHGNGALRIFGSKRVKVTGEWKKLHNEELHNLYYSPNTGRVVKSRKMIWMDHTTHMTGAGGGVINGYKILFGKAQVERQDYKPVTLILKLILEKYGVKLWT
jgi:hypothetical protein